MDKFRLTNEHLYIGFIRTLESFTTELCDKDDIFVSTRVFEDFDIYVRIYLCEDNLRTYLDEGWIDRSIADKSTALLESYCALEQGSPGLRNVEAVKTSKEWRILMELSEDIRKELYYIPEML